MNTYGLNRHLNSFGLSYPGYWFILVGGSRPFVAYGTRDYIVGKLAREFPAYEIRVYTAKRGGIVILNRNFHVYDTFWFATGHTFNKWIAIESRRYYAAITEPRDFEAEENTSFKTKTSKRAFIAQVIREYNL